MDTNFFLWKRKKIMIIVTTHNLHRLHIRYSQMFLDQHFPTNLVGKNKEFDLSKDMYFLVLGNYTVSIIFKIFPSVVKIREIRIVDKANKNRGLQRSRAILRSESSPTPSVFVPFCSLFVPPLSPLPTPFHEYNRTLLGCQIKAEAKNEGTLWREANVFPYS